MARTFRRVNPVQFKFDQVDLVLEGTFEGSRELLIKGKPAMRVSMETEEMGEVFFFASTVLQNLLESVDVGEYVRITFTGEEPSDKGNSIKLFDLEVAVD